LPRRGRSAGFTLFELIVVIILVAVLSAVLLGRFLTYQEMAEKVAMEQTVGAIQSALTIQLAGLIARGRMQDIPRLAKVNPMTLLSGPQKNYAGEYFTVKPGDIPSGNWYFDLKNGQLAYSVQHGAHFVADENGNKVVRYKVVLVYNNWFRTTSDEEAGKEIGGITLKEARPYSWTIQ
jgi:prepilin-type N-terminal cleavage/methylation domain-containing protein